MKKDSLFPPAPARPAGCASPLQIDEHLAGDGGGGLAQHLATCSRCGELVARAERERAAFRASAPPLRPPAATRAEPRAARSVGRRGFGSRLAAGLGACVMAAAAFVLVREGTLTTRQAVSSGQRAKGTAAAEVFVKGRDGSVRAVVSGDAVRAGEAIQFELGDTAGRHVAVLGRDGTGRTSVLFPDGAAAARPAQAQKFSFVVDDAPGPETFHVLFCADPVPLAGVRAALERAGAIATPPPGCAVQRLWLSK